MAEASKLSYLVPRDPSIKCWEDRVRLPGPLTTNVVKFGIDALDEESNCKLKVYLRIKPSQECNHPYKISADTLEVVPPDEKKISRDIGTLVHKFQFSKIFNEDSTQENIFDRCVLNNLKEFVNGQNNLLFAYGTTNAGKTFTIQGTIDKPGIIPRAIQFVFSCLKNNMEPVCHYQPSRFNDLCLLTPEEENRDVMHKNFILHLDLAKYQRFPEMSYRSYRTECTWSSGYSDSYKNETYCEMENNMSAIDYEVGSSRYSVWISMIEIHNEQIYDLLEVPKEKGTRTKLAIAEDCNGKVYIKNLQYVNVMTGHEAMQVYQFGRTNLRLGPTALNNESSRSHCIFTLTLAKYLDNGDEAILSRYSFCDLAGSERVKKALTYGVRLAESKSINTSLSIFAKCLHVIKENQANGERKMVPYRESKLTRLFRDAMIGKQTFSIVVNITPEPHLFNETVYVLKFSAIAQQIITVKAVPKRKPLPVKRNKFVSAVANVTDSADVHSDSPSLEIENKSKIFELLKIIDDLRDELAEERRRADYIENEVRENLSQEFRKMFRDFNEKNKSIHDREIRRMEEMHDRQKKRLIEYYENQNRLKRKRTDGYSFDCSEMENKIKQMEKDVQLFESENDSLRQLIQNLTSDNKKLQRKCTELEFRVSENNRLVEACIKYKETDDCGDIVRQLQNQVEEGKTKITEFKNLLDESAYEYEDLRERCKYLIEENESLMRQLAAASKAEDANAQEDNDDALTVSLRRDCERLQAMCAAQEGEIKSLQSEVKTLTRQNMDLMRQVELCSSEKSPSKHEKLHDKDKRKLDIENRSDPDYSGINSDELQPETKCHLKSLEDEKAESPSKLKEKIKNLENLNNEMKENLSNMTVTLSEKEIEINELREEVMRLREAMVKETPEKSSESGNDFQTETNGCQTDAEEHEADVEDTPDKLSSRIEKLSMFHSERKKSCKKIADGVEESLHPSLIKSKRKGKKGAENDGVQAVEDAIDSKAVDNRGKKCTRKLFAGNDFECFGNLESSFVEPEIPRLRPRRK